MSHLVHSLTCKCGKVFQPEHVSGDEECHDCGRMVVRPPEPTVEELSHTIATAEKHLAWLKHISQPGQLQKLVDQSLARISMEKAYISNLQTQITTAPAKIEEYNQWMGDLLEQKQELILRKAASTRETTARRAGTQPATKRAQSDKLKLKLGDVVFARLEAAFGSAEKVLEMWKA